MNALTRCLALWVGLWLTATALAAPLPFVWYELGDEGADRNVAPPERVVDNLKVRGWELTPAAPGRVAWSEALAPGAERLVGATVRFGTRLETVMLLLDVQGRTRLAVRRPAASTFIARIDRGQPGPDQGLVNAGTEICADLAHAMPPAPLPGKPLGIAVSKLVPEDNGPATGRLEAVDRYGLEALTIAVLTSLGHPAGRAAGPADVKLAASREAVQVTVDFTTADGRYTKSHLPQESLWLYLQEIARVTLRPDGKAIADFRLLHPEWRPVELLQQGPKQLLYSIGEKQWRSLSFDDGNVSVIERAPILPGLTADAAALRLVGDDGADVWKRSLGAPLGGGLCQTGNTIYAFTDDERLHRIDAATGEETAAFPIGRRVRGAAGALLHDRLWVTDFDGNLLALDPATGKIDRETPLGEVLLVPLAPFGDGLLAITRGRDLIRLDAAGTETGRQTLPAPAVAAVWRGEVPWLADREGGIWRCLAGEAAPQPVVDLRQRLVGLLTVASFPDKWQLAAKSEQADDFDLSLSDSSPKLLVLTAEGMAITLK